MQFLMYIIMFLEPISLHVQCKEKTGLSVVHFWSALTCDSLVILVKLNKQINKTITYKRHYCQGLKGGGVPIPHFHALLFCKIILHIPTFFS